jgi:hypothetical protein
MKRLAVGVAVALAAVAVYAVTAGAGPQAVSPKRVAALEKKVTQLQRQVRTLNTFMSCLNKQVAGLASYGNPNAGQGYVYATGQGNVTTTALDLTGQGEQPQFFVAAVEASCVTSGRMGHVQRRVAR